MGVDELNQYLDWLYEDIEFALNKSCKMETIPIRIPGFGWWTKELAAQKRNVRRIKDYVKYRGKGSKGLVLNLNYLQEKERRKKQMRERGKSHESCGLKGKAATKLNELEACGPIGVWGPKPAH